jgi:hypothetical protein
MPFKTRRSSTRATPRGLFGSSGWMIDHSKSVNSYRRGVMAQTPLRSLNQKAAASGIPL